MNQDNPTGAKDELNEQELWELLKDYDETPAKGAKRQSSAPAKKPAQQPKSEKAQKPREYQEEAPITEKRKRALIWYLVGLFGIAFVIVLASLIMRSQSIPNADEVNSLTLQVDQMNEQMVQLQQEKEALSQENEELKAENQALTDKVSEQQIMMDGLNVLIDELSQSLEYQESNALYNDGNAEKLAATMNAYQTLVRAQNALIVEDVTVLRQAMAELEEQLELLSSEALNAYYMVIEYMEQPYLGRN